MTRRLVVTGLLIAWLTVAAIADWWESITDAELGEIE